MKPHLSRPGRRARAQKSPGRPGLWPLVWSLALAWLLTLAVSAGLAPALALAQDNAIDRLVVADAAAAQELDPHLILDSVTQRVCLQIYEGLLDMPRPGVWRPLLATGWWQTGPRTWRFQIRPGVRFHDGRPLDAQAVAFSLRRAAQGPQRDLLPLKAVRVLGPLAVEVSADCPDLLPRLAHAGLVLSPGSVREGGLIGDPVGTGPYRFLRRQGGRVVLGFNRDYWGGDHGLKADELVFAPSPGGDQLIADLAAGRVQVALGLNPHLKMALMTSGAPVRLYTQPSARQYFLVVNPSPRRPAGQVALYDPEFRRALNQALDLERIIDVVLLGNGLAPDGVLNPQIHGYRPQPRPPYDPVGARRTIARLAPQGLDLVLAVPRGRYPMAESVCQAVARYLEQAGVGVRVVEVPWPQFLAKVLERDTGDWDLYFLGWGNPPLSASYTLNPAFCASPLAKVCPPGLDRLLAAAFAARPERAVGLYGELQDRVYRLAPWVYLHQGLEIHASRREITLLPRANENLRVFYDLSLEAAKP